MAEAKTPVQSESDLVAAAKKGDPDAFEALVVAHQDRVFGLCVRMIGHREDAEEVAASVFLSAFRALPRFRGECAFGTWLFRIAVNLSKNRLRTYARRPQPKSLDAPAHEGGDPPIGNLRSERPGPDAVAEGAELSQRVEASLLELSEEEREILLLRDGQGLDYPQIAAALEIPEGTVKSRISRARGALKALLAPYLGPERKGKGGV